MGNGKSKLSDEQITEVFKSVDADDNGVLDPLELMAASNKLIDRQVTSKLKTNQLTTVTNSVKKKKLTRKYR
jgi:hypothetical protein